MELLQKIFTGGIYAHKHEIKLLVGGPVCSECVWKNTCYRLAAVNSLSMFSVAKKIEVSAKITECEYFLDAAASRKDNETVILNEHIERPGQMAELDTWIKKTIGKEKEGKGNAAKEERNPKEQSRKNQEWPPDHTNR